MLAKAVCILKKTSSILELMKSSDTYRFQQFNNPYSELYQICVKLESFLQEVDGNQKHKYRISK